MSDMVYRLTDLEFRVLALERRLEVGVLGMDREREAARKAMEYFRERAEVEGSGVVGVEGDG